MSMLEIKRQITGKNTSEDYEQLIALLAQRSQGYSNAFILTPNERVDSVLEETVTFLQKYGAEVKEVVKNFRTVKFGNSRLIVCGMGISPEVNYEKMQGISSDFIVIYKQPSLSSQHILGLTYRNRNSNGLEDRFFCVD